jgi:hemerythrin
MDSYKYGIAWDDHLLLGNTQVDEQHKRLFGLLGELVEQCIDGTSTERLQETLDFLVEYTVRHFRDEEVLQVRCNFPEYNRHKELHEEFKKTVSGLVQQFSENGSSTELSNSVNSIVIKWLIGHILREDKKIGNHIRNMRTREINPPER